jgi:hypothetical protein
VDDKRHDPRSRLLRKWSSLAESARCSSTSCRDHEDARYSRPLVLIQTELGRFLSVVIRHGSMIIGIVVMLGGVKAQRPIKMLSTPDAAGIKYPTISFW